MDSERDSETRREHSRYERESAEQHNGECNIHHGERDGLRGTTAASEKKMHIPEHLININVNPNTHSIFFFFFNIVDFITSTVFNFDN